MAEEPPPVPATAPPEPGTVPETVVVRQRRPWWARLLKWTAIGLVGLVVLAGLLLFAIDTQPGRRFVADRISRIELASGLSLRVGRIDGSIYNAMVLRDVQIRDQKGAFATAGEIRLDWRPFAWFRNQIDVRALTSPLVRVSRMPALKPVPRDPDAPWLPDIQIDVSRIAIDRIDFAPAVTGRRHIARLEGSAHIADRRAQVVANATTLVAPGVVGGDKLALRVDAVPDDNKFDLDLNLAAPKDGLVVRLAGLEAPLTIAAAGKGSWASWDGTLASTLGGQPLAKLRITARDGTFKVVGPLRPGLILKGPVERLTDPQLGMAFTGTLDDRVLDARLALRSSALQFFSAGRIDLGNNRFEGLRTEAALLTPGVIAPNLVGRSVQAVVVLDGPFATPVVDYRLTAGALGFNTTVLEGLTAEGRARVDADRILVPVNARVARVTGLNATVGGLVTNLRLTGDFAITGDQILSDNLRLVSDRVNATAVIAADISSGRYTGALKGRVNDVMIDGVGVVHLTTDANLYAARDGGWGIRGQVAGTTARIFNDGVRSFLGGNAVFSVRLDYGPDGIVNFNTLRMRAPAFRITDGSGRFDPNGPLAFNAQAYSTQYGPLSARVTGSLTQPVMLLRAPRPGLGVDMTDLVANVRGKDNAFAVNATGETSYGPFKADVLIATAAPLTVDIRSARFAGMDIAGRIKQTPTGPFAGRLTFVGSGINGSAELRAAGKVQAAAVDAKAYQAKIPGQAGLTIGRALIKADVILYPDKPQVVADAQLASVRSGELVLTAARVRIDYRGGRGTAQAVASGSTGVPFKVAANARLNPGQWDVALQGQGNGIDFHTVQPARIMVSDDGYRLMPTRVEFDRGTALLAGNFGTGTVIQARIEKLDLSVINAFVPGLGLGGAATGSFDFIQRDAATAPQAIARAEVANFTRASLTSVSSPVDVSLTGKMLPAGSDLRVLIKKGGATIGRIVATLQSTGGEGTWSERLARAPLSGGIRYNGPATVPFSLAGLTGQHVSGPIGIAADFSGRLEHPQLTGVVRGNNLIYENEAIGTRLTALSIDGRFNNDRLDLTSLKATAGQGTVTASGTIGLAAAASFPIDITADFANAQLARSDALGASATGRIRVTHGPNGGRIQGRLDIPEARYEIIRQGAAEVAELTGIRRKSELTQDASLRREPPPPAFGTFDLALRIRADNRLFVTGMGLESEWSATINVTGTSANPQIRGDAEIVRGTYSFAGKRFEISRGRIEFNGGPLADPRLDIAATTTAEGITAIIEISGRAQQPRIEFSSTPSLPQDEVLSRLLFGTNVTNLSATEAIQLAAALNTLSGGGGGLNPLGKLRSATGIDRLNILAADDATGRGTALAAGKYLTDNIYIEIITDTRGYTAMQMEIALTRALSLLSSTGSYSGTSASLRYSRDY